MALYLMGNFYVLMTKMGMFCFNFRLNCKYGPCSCRFVQIKGQFGIVVAK